MRSPALVLVALVVLAMLPLRADAQAPPVSPLNPGAVTLYLSNATLPAQGGNAETLSAARPTSANDTTRSVSAGAVWYALPAPQRALVLGDNVSGTIAVNVAPVTDCTGLPLPLCPPLPGATVNATFTLELDKYVTSSGARIAVANATQSVQLLLNPVQAPTNLTWTLSPANVTLQPGETLALNITGTATPAVGTLLVVYNSVAHPGGINVTLSSAVRGGLQLTPSAAGKQVAPGGSAVYVINVRNTNPTDTDVVSLSATGQPGDWPVRLSSPSVSVPGNGATSVTLTVNAPTSAPAGAQHTATVTAVGTSGATASLNVTTTVQAAAGGGTGVPCTGPGVPANCGCSVSGQTDSDCDGYSDVDEKKYGSDPFNANSTPDNTDSDGDGFSNKAEIDAGCDPFNAQDVPLPGGGCGAPGAGRSGGAAASSSPLAFLSGPVASALGVDSGTADIIAGALILLFLLILLLLVWLLLGGYPVKLSLAEPRAVTEPGRAADYSVVVRNRLRAPQTVDLDVAQVPNDWDVRFAQPRLQLEGKASESVGLLVRPPDNWPAPSKREFVVRARSRVKPGKFAKAAAKLLIQPLAAGGVEAPVEEAVPEPEAFPPQDVPEEPAFAPAPAPAAPVPPGPGAGPFRVRISGVRHEPAVPERGGEVTTTARVDNQGDREESVRVLLVVNGKVRDEVRAELAPGEGAEAEFHWVAYLARNEVKVVAERS